jgi:hypothetical protein
MSAGQMNIHHGVEPPITCPGTGGRPPFPANDGIGLSASAIAKAAATNFDFFIRYPLDAAMPFFELQAANIEVEYSGQR